jgi:hypothetical protein
MKNFAKNVQSNGHIIEVCGPQTGHSVKAIAFCDSAETAKTLVSIIDSLANTNKLIAEFAFLPAVSVSLREQLGRNQALLEA